MRASTDIISPEAPITLDLLNELIARNEGSALGKFIGDKSLSKKALSGSLSEKINTRLLNGSAFGETLWEKETGRTVGIVTADEANWDTEHFGIRMGKITLAVFDEKVGLKKRIEVLGRLAKKIDAKMLSARVNLTDLKTIQALEKMGAILTDVLLTYRFDLKNQLRSTHAPRTSISPVREDEAYELAHIGRSIFTVDRFHGDPNLSAAKSSELYGKWVLNSANGLAQAVLVARDGDKIAGFITCKVEQINSVYKFGTIDLVGVRPSFAGLGIGRELVQSALKWFTGRVPSVYVGTQAANTRAVRLYEGSKFAYACSEATFHLWADSNSKTIASRATLTKSRDNSRT